MVLREAQGDVQAVQHPGSAPLDLFEQPANVFFRNLLVKSLWDRKF